MSLASITPKKDVRSKSFVGGPLSVAAFMQLSGEMAGSDFVKIVLDRDTNQMHFINNNVYKYHAEYIAEQLLDLPKEEVLSQIDDYNYKFYHDPDRMACLGILTFHTKNSKSFFTLETVEVDTMGVEMLLDFFNKVKQQIDPAFALFFIPINHSQEKMIQNIDKETLPRIYVHEMQSTKSFLPLNEGKAKGRLRVFKTEKAFRDSYNTIEWYDILVMDKIPEDIPRVSGIINSAYTTPLSHTNVLAHGWEIPNSIQLGIIDELISDGLNFSWVIYQVGRDDDKAKIEKIATPEELPIRPPWKSAMVDIEPADNLDTPIVSLADLRMTDRFRYGTKASNIGELFYLLKNGSPRMLGYYNVSRPPRENLRRYLAQFLDVKDESLLEEKALEFLNQNIRVPRGIALPFSFQWKFLEKHPAIHQQVGKLKMALELNIPQIDSLCIELMNMIKKVRMNDELRGLIDEKIVRYLAGCQSFVVRSSSNAEDLENFSAAGIYESKNKIVTAERIFESIKTVWASLVSPRSTKLRHDARISLDDAMMGVIIQEEIKADFGGVMVTTNPVNPHGDFRNVYINCTANSVVDVVDGNGAPYQYLFNTVEGGGRTLSLGSNTEDLSNEQKEMLQKLSFAGRLLQSHFSSDYTFSCPEDIEWVVNGDYIYIIQIRPYSV